MDQMHENNWLRRAKKLHAIASTGLHYCRDEYDRERYEEIAEIARGMLADITDVPVDRIEGIYADSGQGYATPKIDVRAAIIEHGKIVLVREKSDGLWTLPGGFAEIGLSPRENVVKEVLEEAGVAVEVQALYSIRHKAKHAYPPDILDFYKLFFLCRRVDATPYQAGSETVEVGLFAPDDLPALSTLRVLEADILDAFSYSLSPIPTVVID